MKTGSSAKDWRSWRRSWRSSCADDTLKGRMTNPIQEDVQGDPGTQLMFIGT
jgi:hypothetical protein